MSDRPTAQELIDRANDIIYHSDYSAPTALALASALATLAVAQAILETGEKK